TGEVQNLPQVKYVWSFLREEEQWRYCKGAGKVQGWMVATEGVEPMEQDQTPQYVYDRPSLMTRFLEWKSDLEVGEGSMKSLGPDEVISPHPAAGGPCPELSPAEAIRPHPAVEPYPESSPRSRVGESEPCPGRQTSGDNHHDYELSRLGAGERGAGCGSEGMSPQDRAEEEGRHEGVRITRTPNRRVCLRERSHPQSSPP
ncbi:unnamed protein product, partial [Discosporangium mesarthrocarpum]